jgi:hypothetical protein
VKLSYADSGIKFESRRMMTSVICWSVLRVLRWRCKAFLLLCVDLVRELLQSSPESGHEA